MRRTPTFLLAACTLVVCGSVCLFGCAARASSKPQRFRKTRMQMGTFVTITVYAPTLNAAQEAADAAFARIDEVNALMSSYLPDSELSRLNRSGGKPFVVSKDTFAVLREAVAAGDLTGGAFDVTIGPLRRLWQAAGKANKLPTPAQIAAAKKRVGYEELQLDPNAYTARLLLPGMEVNLGGIAKGFAVDKAIEVLRQQGIKSALVDAGGDLYALGTRGDGKPWRVGVQNPTRPRGSSDFPAVLELSDRAVATSGDYQQFVVIEGKRYSHIIDPASGWPVDRVPSATIIAPTCMRADALATATSVLDVKESLQIIHAQPQIEGMLITVEGSRLVLHRSAGFRQYEVRDGGR